MIDTLNPRQSCLVAKLDHFVSLTKAEKDLIHRLEGATRTCTRGQLVWRQGESVSSMYVLQSGWMYGFAILPNGQRQVLDIYCPGDVLGLRDIVFDYSVSSVAAASNAVLCPFPKTAMDDVFIESPRLATLLYSLGMLENIVVIDRLKAVASLDARERVCYFLLQLLGRLKITNPTMQTKFDLPMTQELMGDAMGLSQVHINRTLKKLEDEDIILREGIAVELLNLKLMREISGFENRHYRIDTSWFPGNLENLIAAN